MMVVMMVIMGVVLLLSGSSGDVDSHAPGWTDSYEYIEKAPEPAQGLLEEQGARDAKGTATNGTPDPAPIRMPR